jgi:hypothetical protein
MYIDGSMNNIQFDLNRTIEEDIPVSEVASEEPLIAVMAVSAIRCSQQDSQMVVYIDNSIEDAQLVLNRVRNIPVAGLPAGIARVLVGGGQLVTAVVVSTRRYIYLSGENQHEINYILRDGAERSSRAAANILLGAVDAIESTALLINPVALFYRVFEYVNRQNHR